MEKNGELPLRSRVTIFVGENGTGKSTLIEGIAIACGFNAEGGTKNFTFKTAEANSDLHEYIRISRTEKFRDGFFLRAESFFNLATEIEKLGIVRSYGGISLHDQSHGESFLALVKNRFGGKGLYILDEPEAALSPMRLLTLMALIHDLEADNSQFIIATHSPILMSYPKAQILQLSDNGIEEVDYKDTEHYQITKRMIENPESIFRYLFV